MIRKLGTGVVAAWMIVGGLFVAATVFYGSLFFAINPTPWNFPGDPPLFDLLVFAGAIAAAINLPLGFFADRLGARRSLARFPRLCGMVGLAMFVVSCAGILERQDWRWASVRNGIRQYGDIILAASGDKNRVLSHQEFEALKQRFMPTPVPVFLPGYGMVQLRMAHGVYPYVGVDFKAGGHALFNLPTMWCAYSD